MIKTLVQDDEFPVKQDTETGEIICIGYCSLCPAFNRAGNTGTCTVKNKTMELWDVEKEAHYCDYTYMWQ